MRRDLHVYLSYRTRIVSQVLTSVFSLTLFYYVSRLVHVSGFGSPGSYFGFVVVGIALVSILYSCFSIPELVRQELIAGTFDRLLLSPFGAIRSVIAMTLFPLLYSFVLAAFTLGLGVRPVRVAAALVDGAAERAGDGPGAARVPAVRAAVRRADRRRSSRAASGRAG